jgi:hypothetical protein
MVVALMIPMPVAAKSSAGGKLVKSVTTYGVDKTGQGWEFSDYYTDKVTYKYGKKNTPTEITYTNYTTYLGVPVAGSSTTTKIKYKGKTAKEYDTAGFVNSKTTFKKGNAVSWSWEYKWSEKRKNAAGAVIDWANQDASIGHASYFKNGLMKAQDRTDAGVNSDNDSYTYTENSVYSWTQKKGVPSLMYATTVENGKDDWGRTYDGTPSTKYAVFNTKGLVVEEGYVVDGKNVPDKAYTYTMKKGKVDTVVVYDVDPETKQPTPEKMMKFKYTNKSVSKTFNLKMMNSLVGCDAFRWF